MLEVVFLSFILFPILIILGIGFLIYLIIKKRKNNDNYNKNNNYNWRGFALSSAIALIFPFMIYHGLNAFFNEPIYSNYVTTSVGPPELDDNYYERLSERESQRHEYNDAIEQYELIVFFVWLTVGIVAILGGSLINLSIVGSGFSWGGIFSVIIGYAGYFSYMSSAVIFLSAILALIGFTIFSYKRFGGKNLNDDNVVPLEGE